MLSTDKLLKILAVLYKTFPNLQRVTTYAGPLDILHKSDEELKALYEAGLKMAYYGMETGDSELLKEVKKGVNQEQSIEAGQKIVRSGMLDVSRVTLYRYLQKYDLGPKKGK